MQQSPYLIEQKEQLISDEDPEWTEDDLFWVLAWITYCEETNPAVPNQLDKSSCEILTGM